MSGSTVLGNGKVGISADLSLRKGPPAACYQDPELLRCLIRDAVRQSGPSGEADFSLSNIIRPGVSVLIKPNWVQEFRPGSPLAECLLTHENFIMAALEEVLHARPGRILIGDAPIQGCNFGALVSEKFMESAKALSRAKGVPLDFVDFRRVIVPTKNPGLGLVVRGERGSARQVHFDLKVDSMLESISSPHGKFRGIHYSPDTLSEVHRSGRHEYLLCREVFEVDVILNMPKLKTHRRAGLTASLKNLVGVNSDKDYLPHHRIGGSEDGGDCYPGHSLGKRIGEFFCDQSDRNVGNPLFMFWRIGYFIARRCFSSRSDGRLEAAWFGNDTTWRMVLDLNRILIYGRPDGTMADEPQRKLYSLTDGIVAGDHEGPLHPEPLIVGAVTFGDNSPNADAINSALLRLDFRKIPLIREAFGAFRWPLTPPDTHPLASYGSHDHSPEDVCSQLGVPATPAAGWVGKIEWVQERGAAPCSLQ